MNTIRTLYRGLARLPVTRGKRCNMCGHSCRRFLPYRSGSKSLPSLLQELEIIGSNVDQFECPWCGCHDRERHLLMYLTASGMINELGKMAVLHFAPEPRLAERIRKTKPARYVQCDLFPQAPGVERVDILAMPYSNASFDLVLANHVLEHVGDDNRALREIHRVLRPGGATIVQTPYAAALHRTWCDPGITSPSARLEAYGQEDHVRLFGRDIFERFATSGLEPHVRTHSELLGAWSPERFGVNQREPFFLFKKPAG